MSVLRFTTTPPPAEGQPPVVYEVLLNPHDIAAIVGHPEGPCRVFLSSGVQLAIDARPDIARQRWEAATAEVRHEGAAATTPQQIWSSLTSEEGEAPRVVHGRHGGWDPDLGPPSDEDLERLR